MQRGAGLPAEVLSRGHVLVGAGTALTFLSATGSAISLQDATTTGDQLYMGAASFASTYVTGGGDFDAAFG